MVWRGHQWTPDLGWGPGEDGFNAVGPVTCEKEGGKKNVSL